MAELKLSVMRYTDAAIGRGAAIMVKKPFMVRTLFPILHTRLARIIHNFATSAGCRLKPVCGIPIHLVAPWEVIPRGVFTRKIRIMDTTYPRVANRSQKVYGILAMTIMKTRPMILAISCLFI